MTNKKSGDDRRKLLKSIVAGSGVIVAGKSIPKNWSRPVVDSVMLPAHAQTSISINNSNCNFFVATQSGLPATESTGDIAILFSNNACSMIEFDSNATGMPADAMIAFDSDMIFNLLWDDLGAGSNWTRVGTNIPGADDNANGSYFVDVSSGGSTYRVSFTINVSSSVTGPPYATGTMTVSNVTIVLL